MSERKPIVGGNWKMNLHAADAEALIAGLVSGGAKVFDIGCGPTPMLYFAARAGRAAL